MDSPKDPESGFHRPPDARGTIFEPEENVITEETEEEVIDPELDDRERRKKRIFSFLKKQGAKIGNKSVV
jgi:hypothetical protein